MKTFIIMIAVLMSALISCDQNQKEVTKENKHLQQKETSREEDKVKSTVVLYLSLLAKGYEIQNMNALSEAATQERIEKAYYHMAALNEGNVKMITKLRELKFNEVNVLSPDAAEASTVEKWDYHYINVNSGDTVYENSVEYKLTYHLIKKGTKWLVNVVDVEYTKEQNPEKYRPLMGRSGEENKGK